MKIKVCGMLEAENIRQISGLKPDYMGFIFYPKSKRFVKDIDLQTLTGLPKSIKKTGVFVNEDIAVITDKIKEYQLDAVQLHGNETPEFCKALRKEKTELIKAFGVDENFDFNLLGPYQDVVDYFLFDTKTSGHGGSGITFNWEILERYFLDKPYFLSGGLNLDNLKNMENLNDNRLYAADLNSRFETGPGIKDVNKLKLAINLIKEHD